LRTGNDVDLSERKLTMLTYVAQGVNNQEIAELEFVSINSDKTYLRTAYRKIGVQTCSQAVSLGAPGRGDGVQLRAQHDALAVPGPVKQDQFVHRLPGGASPARDGLADGQQERRAASGHDPPDAS
jgi:DNA-binding CsgD family transcriptional regulator